MINPIRFLFACYVWLLVFWHTGKRPACERQFIALGSTCPEERLYFDIRRSQIGIHHIDPRHPKKGGPMQYARIVGGGIKLRVRRWHWFIRQIAKGLPLDNPPMEKKPNVKKK